MPYFNQKKSILNFVNKLTKSKLILTVKNWFNETITQPIKDKKAKRAHDKYVKELKYNFDKMYSSFD